ncbi:hybrid sensor histidine kinase/response regulator [Salinispira pacifica]
MSSKKVPTGEQTPSVLVVDDVAETLQVVGNLLKNQGYDVRLATNGEQALRGVKFDPPDLILLDISMPGMDGFEVCTRLKAQPESKDIPVIFFTAAYVTQEQMRRGFEVGAVDYITKPVDDPILVARVNTHVSLRRSRQQLEVQNRGLKEANDAKNKLFSIMGHDLKNVFSGLNTLIDLMLKDFDGIERDEKLQYLSEMRRASQQTLSILEDIVQWSRLERGMIIPNPRETNLTSVVDDALDLVRPQAEKKEILLGFTPTEVRPLGTDAEMLHVILRNLLTNAVKFTPRGGRVEVELVEERSLVRVSVRDTGIGISEDKMRLLFQYADVAEIGTEGESGTGLGLMICREMVEALNGQIWAESSDEGGAVFHFTLPVNARRPAPAKRSRK